MYRIWTSVVAVALVAVVTIACTSVAQNHARHDTNKSVLASVSKAVAVLQSTAGNQARGVVYFEQNGDQVRVSGRVEGLNPNQQHGFHVHEFGDLTSSDGTAAGGHYNPEGHAHGLPNGDDRHAGDFGNLQADANGVAEFEFTVTNITIAGKQNSVIGRGLIVHAQPDDGGQPVGNAGARIAQAVIGVANTSQ